MQALLILPLVNPQHYIINSLHFFFLFDFFVAFFEFIYIDVGVATEDAWLLRSV